MNLNNIDISKLPADIRKQYKKLQVMHAEKQIQNKAKDDFMSFVKCVWPDFIEGSHHRHIAKKFNQLATGEITRLIVNMPPRHTKSEFASYLLPAWMVGREPKLKIIQATHTGELAVRFGRKAKNLIDSEDYSKIFKTTLQEDSKAAGRWETAQGGEYFAAGVGGAITGRGADLLIIDDPHSEQDAMSPTAMESAYEWYTSGPRQRLQPGGKIILVMTRWSNKDLTGKLLANQGEAKADQWHVVEFPAILDHGSKKAAPVWPEYWKLDELEKVQATLPTAKWNAQWMQSPTSEEGAILKREWWRTWKHDWIPELHHVIQSYDTAFLKKETADYSAITTWGVFYPDQDSGANLMLLDSIKGRYEFPELRRLALEQYKYWQPESVIVEAKASGLPLTYELRQMDIPVVNFTPSRGNDKHSRVNAVAPLFESGMIWAPEQKFADEVIEECAAFPYGDHDDLVDSTTQAIMRFRQAGLLQHPEDYIDEPREERKKELLLMNAIYKFVLGMIGKRSGVVTTLPNQKQIEFQANMLAEKFMQNGIDPNALKSPEQVKNVLANIDQANMRVISADSAEGRGITEKFLGKKKADVMDMEGNKIPEGSKIMGGKEVKPIDKLQNYTKSEEEIVQDLVDQKFGKGYFDDVDGSKAAIKDAAIKARLDADNKKGIAGIKISLVDDSIAKIKSMEPMEAMKEANLVAGKKGRYANLDDNQVKKIMDDTEDHIFERDIPDEDFATGGRVGLKGGSGFLKFLKKFKVKQSGDDLKEFLSKRKFMKDLIGNTEKAKKARELRMLKEAAEKARAEGGFKFKDVDVDKDIRPIFDQSKDRTLNSDGGRIGLKGGAFLNFIKNMTMNKKSPLQFGKDYLKNVKEKTLKANETGKFMDLPLAEVGIPATTGALINNQIRKKLKAMNEEQKEENLKRFIMELENDEFYQKYPDLKDETIANYTEKLFGEKKADGGRIGFFKGAQADTKEGKSMSPGTDASGGFRGGGEDGGNNNPPPVVKTPPPKPKPKVKKNILTGSFTPTFNFFKKFAAHDRFTDQLKAGVGGKNYHQLGGLDFMARFPDINPSIAKGLASAYQTIFEGGRAIADGPGGYTLGDANKRAKEEARLNAVGIDAFADPDSSLYQEYTDMVPESGAVQMADGGRIGYKVGSVDKMRRLILKAMGAGTVGIGAAKSGIFSFGKGAGKTVAKEVAQQTTSSMPPPYFFKLAEKIKMMGDDATATTDRTIAKTLKSKDGKSTYLLEEDVTTGDTIIKKINKEGDEMITDVEIMELKKGEVVMGKNGKPVKVPDEYEEVTEANARIEGDTFNDPYYTDGIQVDDIIKEVDDKVPSIKYASGGLAYMLGE